MSVWIHWFSGVDRDTNSWQNKAEGWIGHHWLCSLNSTRSPPTKSGTCPCPPPTKHSLKREGTSPLLLSLHPLLSPRPLPPAQSYYMLRFCIFCSLEETHAICLYPSHPELLALSCPFTTKSQRWRLIEKWPSWPLAWSQSGPQYHSSMPTSKQIKLANSLFAKNACQLFPKSRTFCTFLN